jgi:hypothetical protein
MGGKWWFIRNILYTLLPIIILDMLDGIPDQMIIIVLDTVKGLL